MKLLNRHNLILGLGLLNGGSRDGKDDEADRGSSVFVIHDHRLHGKKTKRAKKGDILTIKFLKKYIHYAKHRIQPELTDEVGVFLCLFIYLYFCNYCEFSFHVCILKMKI